MATVAYCPVLDSPPGCVCSDDEMLIPVDLGHQDGGVMEMCPACYVQMAEEDAHEGCARCVPEEVAL